MLRACFTLQTMCFKSAESISTFDLGLAFQTCNLNTYLAGRGLEIKGNVLIPYNYQITVDGDRVQVSAFTSKSRYSLRAVYLRSSFFPVMLYHLIPSHHLAGYYPFTLIKAQRVYPGTGTKTPQIYLAKEKLLQVLSCVLLNVKIHPAFEQDPFTGQICNRSAGLGGVSFGTHFRLQEAA